ncbi:MAG: flagellar biosynthetic protein FliR [Candidatus Hydrogenedentes bacterium]|nr:flagellar biosynthetic protein FliR [Candidatus Hydrogenedentota bacterium]
MIEILPTKIFEVDLFLLYVLTLMRISGFLVSMPVLGSRNIPMVVKAGLAGILALTITPLIPPLQSEFPKTLSNFIVIGTLEILIGVGMGFIVSIMFAGVQVAGELMDLQTGFGIMNIFNPAMETQFPIFGFFLFLLWAMFFLLINGHLYIIKVLTESYKILPIGTIYTPQENFGLGIAKLGSVIFIYGVRLAGPVLVAMLLTYAVLGVFGRAVPQINLLIIGFPITIGLGFIILAVCIGVYVGVFEEMINESIREVRTFIRGLG